MILENHAKNGRCSRSIFGLALLFIAFTANPATLDDALREYAELSESKAMAVSFSDEPLAINAGGESSDVAATATALGECERARLRSGSDRPCEISRLNAATAVPAEDINVDTGTRHPLFMWRYETGNTRLYLVGSIHVLKATLHPLPSAIEEAFGESDHVAVEIDIAGTDPAAMAKALAKYALLPDDTDVEEGLNAAQRHRLRDELRQLGLAIDNVARLKPFFLATQLSVARLATFGYLPEYGMEAHFLSRLGDRKLHQLETLEQQLALLASPTMADQVEMLVDTLNEMGEIEPTVARMATAWFLGDDDALLRLFEQYTVGSHANRSLLEALIYQRNLTLAAGIQKFLRDTRAPGSCSWARDICPDHAELWRFSRQPALRGHPDMGRSGPPTERRCRATGHLERHRVAMELLP